MQKYSAVVGSDKSFPNMFKVEVSFSACSDLSVFTNPVLPQVHQYQTQSKSGSAVERSLSFIKGVSESHF